MIDFDMFLSLDLKLDGSVPQEAASPNNPVTPPVSSGYCWCLLESIEYHIWVKNRLKGKCIDVDVINDNECYVCGVKTYCPFCHNNTHTTFFQEIITDSDMENVWKVFPHRLELIKESVTTMSNSGPYPVTLVAS